MVGCGCCTVIRPVVINGERCWVGGLMDKKSYRLANVHGGVVLLSGVMKFILESDKRKGQSVVGLVLDGAFQIQ
jgi:hypothetical protein